MMTLESVSHREYSLAERERLHKRFAATASGPRVLLRTCNRIELYTGEGGIPRPLARHLFRVASGLESALLGETAILSQVKQALSAARSEGTVSRPLERLFQGALRCGKRVRRETAIARGAVSHSLAAVKAMLLHGVRLADASFTVIGANRLTRSLILHLRRRGAADITLLNRTLESARRLAEETGCRAGTLAALRDRLLRTEVLVTATSSPSPLVTAADLPAGSPLFVIDLAVPRDVAEEVGALPGIRLLNIENVERLMRAQRKLRSAEYRKAAAIVDDEINVFLTRERGIERRGRGRRLRFR